VGSSGCGRGGETRIRNRAGEQTPAVWPQPVILLTELPGYVRTFCSPLWPVPSRSVHVLTVLFMVTLNNKECDKRVSPLYRLWEAAGSMFCLSPFTYRPIASACFCGSPHGNWLQTLRFFIRKVAIRNWGNSRTPCLCVRCRQLLSKTLFLARYDNKPSEVVYSVQAVYFVMWGMFNWLGRRQLEICTAELCLKGISNMFLFRCRAFGHRIMSKR
jgi:hypothetical protein